MNERKCPACGVALQADTVICPACGLEGLNQLFLTKADYEKWVREVLEPHMITLAPKVFAGNGFGLILTGRGELFGIGENYSGQIDENGQHMYEQPHLMTKDVVSAAAGGRYSIYVTRDGQVHLRGRGELAERFSRICNAQAVYADPSDSFWVGTDGDWMLGFGTNKFQGGLEKRIWRTLDPETYVVHYGEYIKYESGVPVYITEVNDTSKQRGELQRRIKNSAAYRKAVHLFGGRNVELLMDDYLWANVKVTKENERNVGYYGNTSDTTVYHKAVQYTYFPRIEVANRELYAPVPCADCQWMNWTPHRFGSKPASVKEIEELDVPSPGKKLVHNGKIWMRLLQNGTVEMKICETPDCLKRFVADLGCTGDFYIFACANGDILWSNSLMDVVKGTMHSCRLPEGK